MAGPCCGHCQSTNFAHMERQFGGTRGLLIYCTSCGAVLAWTPKP